MTQIDQNWLSDVASENCFWVNNGPIVSNIEHLGKEIRTMDRQTFAHHFNAEKNDFANWVKEVIGDKQLAKQLAKAKGKGDLAKLISKRVSEIKSKSKQKSKQKRSAKSAGKSKTKKGL